MAAPTKHAKRWIWFLDVVFGAIVALGIETYEPVVREAWLQGAGPFALSVFVAIAIFSFVVYDISAYHKLANTFPYCLTSLGFIRFYLDLVMAFTLYILLVNALNPHPDWAAILITVSFWHVAAVAWHLLALKEHGAVGSMVSAVCPHVLFIGIYWASVLLADALGTKVFELDSATLSVFKLVVVSATILVVSIVRWNQVVRKNGAQSPVRTRPQRANPASPPAPETSP